MINKISEREIGAQPECLKTKLPALTLTLVQNGDPAFRTLRMRMCVKSCLLPPYKHL